MVEKRKLALGEDHPDTLMSINNLAGTYWRQGRWKEVEKLQVEVMKKSKQALGEAHQDTLTSMNHLAFTYRALGRQKSALGLVSSCARMSPTTLGIDRPDAQAYQQLITHWEKEDSLPEAPIRNALSTRLIIAMHLQWYVG